MKLTIENVGKIRKANIVLDGITLIAGENNVGKSTIGKVLFAMTYDMDRWHEEYISKCVDSLIKIFQNICGDLEAFCLENTDAKRRRTNKAITLIREICANQEFITEVEDLQIDKKSKSHNDRIDSEIRYMIDGFCRDYVGLYKTNNIDEFFEKHGTFIRSWKNKLIESLITDISLDEVDLQANTIHNSFKMVFENQVITFGEEKATICLEDANSNSYLNLTKNDKPYLSNTVKFGQGVRFIESPKLFDNIGMFFPYADLKDTTISLMQPNATMAFFGRILRKPVMWGDRSYSESRGEISEKATKLLEYIQNVMGGSAEYYSKEGIKFKENKLSNPVKAQNVSSGVKGLAFLEFALKYGAIKEKDILIFDEPEINLHPEWQMQYAKIIVLLRKEMDITIVVTSHSPFFIRAVEVYSEVYNVMDDLNVYLVEEEGVTNVMNTEYGMTELYEKLTVPFDELDRIINEQEE